MKLLLREGYLQSYQPKETTFGILVYILLNFSLYVCTVCVFMSYLILETNLRNKFLR
jgi:hypothetical protein